MTEAEKALVEAAVSSGDWWHRGHSPLYGFAQKVAEERLPTDVVAQYKRLIKEHVVAEARMRDFAQKLPALALDGPQGLTTKLWDEVTQELVIEKETIR